MASLLDPRIVLVPCFFVLVAGGADTEPLCLSRYDYDYKMLQKTFSLEQEQKDFRQLLDKQAEAMRTQDELIARIQANLRDDVRRIEASITRSSTGSAFVRWGRTVCPGNGTEIVYSGYVGGSHYTHTGAAANHLCLPADPLWDKYDDSGNNQHPLYGAEYQIYPDISEKLFNQNIGSYNAPCAVCFSERDTTLMIPGRNACYDGWTVEYAGYLFAGHHSHKAATAFVCWDKNPEVVAGSQGSSYGNLLYPVEAVCGSLKCPPYVEGRELTCVVCTR